MVELEDLDLTKLFRVKFSLQIQSFKMIALLQNDLCKWKVKERKKVVLHLCQGEG